MKEVDRGYQVNHPRLQLNLNQSFLWHKNGIIHRIQRIGILHFSFYLTFERWMGKQTSGLRVYWDGSSLYSRRGEKMDAPSNFIAQIPNVPLDANLCVKSESEKPAK